MININERIKVLITPDGLWHWRDARNRALCDRELDGELITYTKALNEAMVMQCLDCHAAVEMMVDGWNS